MCKVKKPEYTAPVVEDPATGPQLQGPLGVVNKGERMAARVYANRGGAGRDTILTSQRGAVGKRGTADTADREADRRDDRPIDRVRSKSPVRVQGSGGIKPIGPAKGGVTPTPRKVDRNAALRDDALALKRTKTTLG